MHTIVLFIDERMQNVSPNVQCLYSCYRLEKDYSDLKRKENEDEIELRVSFVFKCLLISVIISNNVDIRD